VHSRSLLHFCYIHRHYIHVKSESVQCSELSGQQLTKYCVHKMCTQELLMSPHTGTSSWAHLSDAHNICFKSCMSWNSFQTINFVVPCTHANQVVSVAFTQSGVHQRDPTYYMKGHENICNLFGVTMTVSAAVVHVELMPQGEGWAHPCRSVPGHCTPHQGTLLLHCSRHGQGVPDCACPNGGVQSHFTAAASSE